MNDLFGEEPAQSERLFSQLTTAWYNWSVSETFYQNHVHCWTLTAAYYSMIHAVRTLMNLTRFHREEFVKSHSLFLSFLSKDMHSKKELEMIPKREKTLEELSVNLCLSKSEIDKLFCELGRILKLFKRARTMSSYEKYVIAHQLRSDIRLSSWIGEICRSALVHTAKMNEEVAQLILDYVMHHRFSAYYLHHLDDEIDQFDKLREGEHLIVPEGLSDLIYMFLDKIGRARRPDNMKLFLQCTREYPSKDEQYKKLHSLLEEIRNLSKKNA